MKSFKSTCFLEKGYGHFPYIVVRIRSGLYQQIPIHRRSLEILGLEGVFIEVENEFNACEYGEQCKRLFCHFWRQQLDKGQPADACLVLNNREGYYLSKEGKIGINSIPSGGWLYSAEGKLIQIEGEHYNFKI